MAIIKCKMCGGDLVLVEGQSVAECEYCGSRQTVPVADNEKKLTLFARANRLRASCEFDKAAGIYESIVADFPEEAEAYWGLVLCKYGIEYVDDPVTGKKIPTCHRSSFDSIMDDTNFEQALENADAVARKVYREEAKQIEEIRKGIIAVSSNEQPYDIFICYKETDENGERTLDSVLAQDIYDTLVSRDYRTFFARITLEDKLGMEYEPYIFAALNSAKIMLAIGTDYEYYNAVWVKNEWSRYLKLMTQDKTKHLIPCYKGIDAYDMPKEFARLQAQDLGKVGAMQDLMRGIEKILPKQQKTNVIQERVVVGGSGDNKIASLLDRGNMALEDGDWTKADSFFEDVLNNDSKNAQAYLGKTLAQEKCRTIDAFIRKRKALYQSVRGQKLQLQSNSAHVEEIVAKYTVPGYVEEKEICELYHFDLSYHSDVADRKQQYQNEQTYWTNHKLLSRAEKFAAGNVAENLAREKQALFALLSQQVKQAEAEESAAKKDVQTRYIQHIAQADEKAAQLHQEGTARREKDYRDWVLNVKNSTDVTVLRSAEAFFLAQGDYQKSSTLVVHCRKRITDITAEQDRIAAEEKAAAEAEAERQRILAVNLERQRKVRNKKIAVISAIAAVLVIVAVVVVTTVIIPNSSLSEAEILIRNGDYQGAYDILNNLDGYKNSEELLDEVGKHGMYAVTSVHQDDVDYGDSDYDITMTYNEKGLPLTYEKVSDEGKVYSSWLFEYTWYESGNPETCTVRYASGDINYKMNFYDSSDSRITYIPGEGLNRNTHWQRNYEWIFYGVSCFENYYKGEISYSYRYTECGINADWICSYDADGRLIAYHEGDEKGGTSLTYNKNGEIDVRTQIDDRSDPDSYRNDEYEYRYTYDANGRLYIWEYDWIYDVPERREIYTYDDSGNVTQITTYRRDDYYGGEEYLAEEYIYTLNYEWLDFGQLAEQAAIHRAEEEAALAAQQEQWAAEYAAAEILYQEGKYAEAALAFLNLEGYSNAADRYRQIWTEIDKSGLLSVGKDYTVGLTIDGRILSTRYEFSSLSPDSSDDEEGMVSPTGKEYWDGIVAIAAGKDHVVGLKADGTAIAAGNNTWGQLDVENWTDIVQICASPYHTVGLREDGTVVAVGGNDYGQSDVSSWTDIVAIEVGQVHTVGLRSDGTVVATGYNDDGRCNVSEWTDIVAISASNGHTVGLQKDGTVVASGNNTSGQCDVSGLRDIAAIEAGYFCTIGLKSDGTLVAVGSNEEGQLEFSDWRDIINVWAGGWHTIGLKKDGTLVTAGANNSGQCNLDDWTDWGI